MYQIDLGLQPNLRATAKRVDKFLTINFQSYLNLAGLHRNQLTSPQLSLLQDQQTKMALKRILLTKHKTILILLILRERSVQRFIALWITVLTQL